MKPRTRKAIVNCIWSMAVLAAFGLGRFSRDSQTNWLEGACSLVMGLCAAWMVRALHLDNARDHSELREMLREVERHEKERRP